MRDSNDPLTEILQNTAKTEERTRNIERNLADFQERYVKESEAHNERISDLEEKTQRHDVLISGAIVGVVGALTAFYNWLVGIF